ncbi:hypothetical protein BpHYR1_052812 [Brachionus plicatilis]|uniref:RING-type domain-containing protein n=1 Tax=Brachionus plicatilis TaxID=10195 RepID=A0A3M7P7M7_BRAPC|nr:hypothetical protein BpHYR1_052812 [Brachionus plicatilis]
MNLEDLIKCPKCNQKLDIPAVLPCGETICSKCIPNDESDCEFCHQTHFIPKDGILVNKILFKNLDLLCKNGTKSSIFDSEYEQIKKIYESPSENIDEFFQPLVNHIVTASEMKIRQIENIRDDLTQKIFSLKEDNVNNLKTNNSDFKSTFEELSQLVEEIKIIEGNITLKKDDVLSDKYECLRSKYAIKINKFYQIVRNYKQIRFFKSSPLVSEGILGLIEEKNLKTININEYAKAPFVSNCTNKKTLKILKINKKHFLFIYLGKKFNRSSDLDQELIETKLFDVVLYIEVYVKNVNIKTKEFFLDCECNFYLITNYGGFIYLYLDHSFQRILKKLDSSLEELETIAIKNPLTCIGATKKFVLGFSENNLEIFDHNLILLMTIHSTSSSLFMDYPSKISNMYANKLYYIFQHEKKITIVNQDNGKMVRSFELDSECKIFSVSTENVISAYDKNNSCLLEINLDGKIENKIQLDGFPENIEICLDEDDNFEFVDSKSLILYS